MPILNWLDRDKDVKAVEAVPELSPARLAVENIIFKQTPYDVKAR
jgi:hypothetical protein